MKVVCISGKARHGKDTVAEIMKTKLESDGSKVLVAHFADLVKYVCKQFFNWDGNKDVYGRSLLQKVGTDIVRENNPDYWVSFIADMLTFFDGEWDYVLLPDTRFPNEVSYLVGAGLKTVHLRVVRDNFDNGLTAEQNTHPSETALDNIIPDARIKNNGTMEDLKRAVYDFIDYLKEPASTITALWSCKTFTGEEKR